MMQLPFCCCTSVQHLADEAVEHLENLNRIQPELQDKPAKLTAETESLIKKKKNILLRCSDVVMKNLPHLQWNKCVRLLSISVKFTLISNNKSV